VAQAECPFLPYSHRRSVLKAHTAISLCHQPVLRSLSKRVAATLVLLFSIKSLVIPGQPASVCCLSRTLFLMLVFPVAF